MIIRSAEFVTSAVRPSQYPDTDLPEIAFAGRSNVGKSSMINLLVNRKNMVKTSSTPGKTRLINFFNINGRMMFVDLPGYGYAKVSRKEQQTWGPMVERYLSGRKNLRGLMLLMDLRREPREDEFLMMQWCAHYGIPWKMVLTKADKFKKTTADRRRHEIARAVGIGADEMILFSTLQKMGRDPALETIARMTGILEE
ncbi:MAG: ribosome biogenesis GTP-binding protein YihA/YsxC [Thermodesulfobacteriota bacterium]|nr:ribosome biogenesis GTP-binding protein YihA/YsxC [Thermodesulfobacteriota bacterium]